MRAEDFYQDIADSQFQEVYGHSATVVGNLVWVLGGKNQAGKRISVCPGSQYGADSMSR